MQMPAFLPLADLTLQLVALAILALLACAMAFTLAAAWIRTLSNREAQRWHRLELSWEPVMLRVLTGETTEHQLHTLVRRKDRRFFVGFLLRYARRLRGVEGETVLRLAAPYLSVIVDDLQRRSPERRAYALQTLGELSVAEYSERFLEALEDASLLVAMNAAQALARHYDLAYADRLLRSMERFENWSLRYLAAMLANMGPESASKLRATLSDPSRPPRVRAVVARTLTSLSDHQSLDIATQIIESNNENDLVISALGLIEKVGGPEQLPAVRRLLESTDPAIRAHAVTTLARLGAPEDVDLVRRQLDDSSNWVALHAAEGLEEMGQVELLASLGASDHPRALAAREVIWKAIV